MLYFLDRVIVNVHSKWIAVIFAFISINEERQPEGVRVKMCNILDVSCVSLCITEKLLRSQFQ